MTPTLSTALSQIGVVPAAPVAPQPAARDVTTSQGWTPKTPNEECPF